MVQVNEMDKHINMYYSAIHFWELLFLRCNEIQQACFSCFGNSKQQIKNTNRRIFFPTGKMRSEKRWKDKYVTSCKWSCLLFFGLGKWHILYISALLLCVVALHVSTHQSSVVLILGLMLILMLLHDTGKAAGVGGGAGKVLRLRDGRRPATHSQTTHLGHSDLTNTHLTPIPLFGQ